MSTDPGPGGPRLPDFAGARAPGHLSPPDPTSPGPGAPGDAPPPSRRPWLLGLSVGCGVLLVAVLVLALVLWTAVIRPRTESPPPSADATPTGASEPAGEYIPSEEASEAPVAGPTLIEAPTSACTIHDTSSRTAQESGTVRGGGLAFDVPEGWSTAIDWGDQSAYVTDLGTAEQAVEDGWYSVVGVGAVEVPAEEGGYPGAREIARTILQCDATRDVVRDLYVQPLEIEDYREEPVTVDGSPGWRVTATLPLAQPDGFDVTDGWDVTVLVVDTPDGPAAFVGGAATGMEEQRADLETMVGSLRVEG